jgi:hypothetical protein
MRSAVALPSLARSLLLEDGMTCSFCRRGLVAVALAATSSCGDAPNDRPPLPLSITETAVEVGPLEMTNAEGATPTSVQPLSSLLIAVVDSYEPKIALISSVSGKTMAFFNRRGKGPGEVQSVGPLQLLSDSAVLIPDAEQGRAIVWRFKNGETSTVPLHQSATPRHVLPSLVGYAGNEQWIGRLQSMAEPAGSVVRSVTDTSTLVLFDSSGSRALTRLRPRSLVVAASSSGVSRAGLGGLAPASFAMCDSGFIDVDTSGVRRYSRSGTPIGAHNHKLGWIPMPKSLMRDYIRGMVSRVADLNARARMIEQLESQATGIDRWFGGFFIAPDGTVWLRISTETENAIAETDYNGVPIRAVGVPPGIAVVHVGVGYFIGMRRTDDPETPEFSLFRFTDDAAGQRSRWQCGKQQDY